jgi:hypothetical protein
VAWTLRRRPVDGAMVRFRCPHQIDPIPTAAELELTDEDRVQIE